MLKLLRLFFIPGNIFLLSISTVFSQDGSSRVDAIPTVRFVVPLDSNAAFDHGLADLVRQFNSQEKRFQVSLLSKGNSFQVLRGIIAAHFAGDIPEVALLNAYDVDRLKALNVIKQIPKKFENGDLFNPQLVNHTRCDGSWCSIPFQRRTNVWFYNRELLFKFGLRDSQFSTKWKDLTKTVVKATRGKEICGMSIAASSDQRLSRWWAMGYSLGADPIESSLEWIGAHTAPDTKVLGECIDIDISLDESVKKFMESKTTFLLGGIEQLHFFKSGTEFRMGASIPEGDLSWYGSDIVVLASTELKQKYVESFLNFIYRPETLLELQSISYSIPLGKSYSSGSGWASLAKKEPILEQLRRAKFSPQGLQKLGPSIREEWGRAIWAKFVKAGQSPLEAKDLAELRSKLQNVLSTEHR